MANNKKQQQGSSQSRNELYHPSMATNNDGSLYSLKQKKEKGGVDAYVNEFNRLVSGSTTKWSDAHLTGVFLGGLERELRRDVRLYRPDSLCEAIGLAQGLGSEKPPFVLEEEEEEINASQPRTRR